MDYPAALDEHWLDVQRHLYRCAPHANVSEFYGWSAFSWVYDQLDVRSGTSQGRMGMGLIIPRPSRGYMYGHLERYLAAMQEHMPHPAWMIETSKHRDASLVEYLVEKGWEPLYRLPGWVVTREEFEQWPLPVWPKELQGDHNEIAIVTATDKRRLRQYADVQGAAYEASFKLPWMAASQFYCEPYSLVGPHVQAYLAYVDGRPARTAAMYLFNGVVSVGGGACVPEHRGKHLGDALIYLAFREGFARGAEVGFGTTMPQAVPVAKRLNLRQVVEYTRWSKPVRQDAVG